MNKRLYKIGKNCMACWAGYSNNKEKLPRKKKKLLKKYQHWVPGIHCMVPLCRCNTHEYYKILRNWLPHLKFIEKNKEKIYLLKEYSEECIIEGFNIDVELGELNLFWLWEDDNGLYTYSGQMAAIYDEALKDDTWSFEETKNLITELGLNIDEINNFKDLIRKIDVKKLRQLIE